MKKVMDFHSTSLISENVSIFLGLVGGGVGGVKETYSHAKPFFFFFLRERRYFFTC
jgi:hypothetical protein